MHKLEIDKHIKLDEKIIDDNLNLDEYLKYYNNNSNLYIINNTFFCGVSGILYIYKTNNTLKQMVFKPVNYIDNMTIEGIDSNYQYSKIIQTMTTELTNTYKYKDEYYYSKNYKMIIDNFSIIIKERSDRK